MIQYCFDRPAAVARMSGGGVTGAVSFFCRRGEVYVAADIRGLPREADPCRCRVFGFHIHEGRDCGGEGFRRHRRASGSGGLPPPLPHRGPAAAARLGRPGVPHRQDRAVPPGGRHRPHGGHPRHARRLRHPALGPLRAVDKVGYFKIAAKKMTWKLRKEPLQEWGHLDMLDIRRCDSWKFERI